MPYLVGWLYSEQQKFSLRIFFDIKTCELQTRCIDSVLNRITGNVHAIDSPNHFTEHFELLSWKKLDFRTHVAVTSE